MKHSDKINIPYHNLTNSEARYHVRKQAEAFLDYLNSNGQKIREISVTWTPQGSFGGFLVTKMPEINKENQNPSLEMNKEIKRGIKRKRKTSENLKIKIKLRNC